MIRNIIIKCPTCLRNVCIHDFYCKYGICADCMAVFYADKYKDKIDAYSRIEKHLKENENRIKI